MLVIPEGYATAEELRKELSVSQSAIHRWAARGFVAWMYVDNSAQFAGNPYIKVFHAEQARAHYAKNESIIRRMRNRKCSFDASEVPQSQWELRRHYMALYRTRREGDEYYPAHLCGPEIEQLLAQGHAVARGQGYVMTEAGVVAWAKMNETMLKKRTSTQHDWSELKQALKDAERKVS